MQLEFESKQDSITGTIILYFGLQAQPILTYVYQTPERRLLIRVSFNLALKRKAQCYCNGPRVIETRNFKHFDKGKFVRDLNQLSWANVDLYSDPNNMWREWKDMFLGCVDKLISMHHSN